MLEFSQDVLEVQALRFRRRGWVMFGRTGAPVPHKHLLKRGKLLASCLGR